MANELRILMLEDVPSDAELVQHELRKAGIVFVSRRVDTRETFIRALDEFNPDIALLDYKLPRFDGLSALKIMQGRDPGVPAVMVTGALSDVQAVELLKQGARDYVLKSGLVRLPSAIQQVLSEERDLRARKAAEKALRQSEELCRAVALNANDAIIAIRGTEGQITLWNKKAESMFGYSANEALGKNVHRLIVPDRYREKADSGVKRFLETGDGPIIGRTLEILARRRDGAEFPVELSISGMKSGGGWEAIATVRDISERKKMEEELRVSERKHMLLFEGSRDALMMLAPPSWKFTGANRATLELFRASSVAEFITLGPWDLSPERQPDGRLSSEKALEMNSIAMREGSHFFEWQHQRRDGQLFDVDVLLTRMEVGKEVFLQATVRDITERKKMETALRESEEKFMWLSETVDDVFWIADVEINKMFYISPAYERVWGKTRESLMDNPKSFIGSIHVEDRERVLADLELEKTGQSFDHEYRIIRPAGDVRWISDRGYPVRAKAGQIICYAGVARDITEHKKMEMALRESEARFHRIVENAPFMLGICDPAGRIYYINKRHQETFGYPMEKIPTIADWMRWAYPDEAYRGQVIAQWNDDIRRVAAGELSTAPARTYWITVADGTIRDMEITFTLIDELMYVVFYDVTERVRAQEEVLKLMYAIEQSPVSVVITDKNGDIQYVNEKFCRLTGYTLEEAVGKNPRILKSGEQTQEFYKDLWDTILSGKEWHGRLHNKKKSGELYWENAKISPVRNAQGETTHFIAVKEDITHQIENERKLKFAEQQIILSEKLAGIGQLSAGVCHEILNPLNIISIQVQLMLRREKENSDLTDRLTKIRGEIGRIEKIVGSLMTFSRRGTPELKLAKINDELDLALALVEKDFNVDNINIARDYQWPLPEMEVDTDEMRQVFLNLINNARYEMSGGGTLTVKTRLEKINGRDHVRICFSDTGYGIKKENMTKLFDPFFTTKPEGKGTGMGLPMAHSIVEKHGGVIKAESEEGKGAAFIIDLPVKQGD